MPSSSFAVTRARQAGSLRPSPGFRIAAPPGDATPREEATATSEMIVNADTHPLVTVITPTYNRADYLPEVIESVLSQSYPRLEYIVVDDGSTDATQQILDHYRPQIVVARQANRGEAHAVNHGLSLAHGKYVGVINSDDPALPGLIVHTVSTFLAHPQLVVTYPDWLMIDESGSVIDQVRTAEYSYIEMVRSHHCVPGPGAFFSRSLATRLRGRDPVFRYVGDFDFWLRAGLEGPFLRIPKMLATFRLHSGGASSAARGRRMAEEHVSLVTKLYSRPDLPPDVLSVRREAFSSAYYVAGVVLGDQRSWRKKSFFIRAVITAPQALWTRYRSRLHVIGEELHLRWILKLWRVVRRTRAH